MKNWKFSEAERSLLAAAVSVTLETVEVDLRAFEGTLRYCGPGFSDAQRAHWEKRITDKKDQREQLKLLFGRLTNGGETHVEETLG